MLSIPNWYYNLILIVLPIALFAFGWAFWKMVTLLWRPMKNSGPIYPTTGETPIAFLFNEKELAVSKVSKYISVYKIFGIPFLPAYSPFQTIHITEKGFICTKAHWYYGASSSRAESATDYFYFKKEDYSAILPDEYPYYRAGQVYFFISDITVKGNRLSFTAKSNLFRETRRYMVI